MDNQQRQLSGYGFLYGAIIAIAFLLITNMAEGAEWRHEPVVKLNNSDSLITRPQIEDMVEYSLWSINERTGQDFTYQGTTSLEKETGSIIMRWVTMEEMGDIASGPFVRGVMQPWHYTSDELRSKAIISINRNMHSGATECLQFTIMHEMVHAIGYEGHSDNPHDVMYKGQTDCRYTLSAADVQGLPFDTINTCYVEYAPNGDLYVPMVDGHAASLKLTGEFEWSLDQWAASGGDCSTVSVSGSTAVIHDVRGMGVEYYAELEATGTDEWRLYYAEPIGGE